MVIVPSTRCATPAAACIGGEWWLVAGRLSVLWSWRGLGSLPPLACIRHSRVSRCSGLTDLKFTWFWIILHNNSTKHLNSYILNSHKTRRLSEIYFLFSNTCMPMSIQVPSVNVLGEWISTSSNDLRPRTPYSCRQLQVSKISIWSCIKLHQVLFLYY